MDRLNRMLQAAQGMGISAGGGPGGVSQPVTLRVSPYTRRLECDACIKQAPPALQKNHG